MNKKCNKCEETKPIELFFKDKQFKDGHAGICKVCKKKMQVEWIDKNRDRYNATMRAYNKVHYHRLRLQRYKITPEDFARMQHEQKGVCAVCEKLQKGVRPLVVDHCHDTGKVRGLLCYGCNRAIAILDKADLFERAQRYLAKSKK